MMTAQVYKAVPEDDLEAAKSETEEVMVASKVVAADDCPCRRHRRCVKALVLVGIFGLFATMHHHCHHDHRDGMAYAMHSGPGVSFGLK